MDSLAALITIILGCGTGIGIFAKLWVNRLLPTEKQILVASAEHGEVRLLESDWSGNWIRAGKTDFALPNDRAFAAVHVEAFYRLIGRGFLVHEGGHLYRLTGTGFKSARRMTKIERR